MSKEESKIEKFFFPLTFLSEASWVAFWTANFCSLLNCF